MAGVDARRATPPDLRLPRGGSLAVASSTPATQLLSLAKMLKLNHAGGLATDWRSIAIIRRDCADCRARMNPVDRQMARVQFAFDARGTSLTTSIAMASAVPITSRRYQSG